MELRYNFIYFLFGYENSKEVVYVGQAKKRNNGESGKHANGPFNLGRINALHNDIGSYWSKDAERAPATKYMDLSLMLLWWLRKNKELTVHEKVDKLYEIIQSTVYKGLHRVGI